MTLLRAAARTMLASHFIASGVKAVRDPTPLVPAAEPVADKIVPLVKQYAPNQIAGYIPEDTKTLVRVNGAAQVVGGLALATGRGRRLGSLLLAGSLIPTTIARHPFWSETDPELKAQARSHFLKNVSILGGVLLSAGDTEGKPSLAWRAQAGGHAIAKSTSKATDRLAKKAGSLTDGGGDFADQALAGGAALLGTVVATSRQARKQVAKRAAQQAEENKKRQAQAQKDAAAAAKQAKKDAPKQLRAAKKVAAEQAEESRKRQEQAQKDAAAAAKQAKKDEPKQRRAARRVGRNIQLGSN